LCKPARPVGFYPWPNDISKADQVDAFEAFVRQASCPVEAPQSLARTAETDRNLLRPRYLLIQYPVEEPPQCQAIGMSDNRRCWSRNGFEEVWPNYKKQVDFDPVKRTAQARRNCRSAALLRQWSIGTRMKNFDRITVDPAQMGGIPCVRHLRIPVATVLRLLAGGLSQRDILAEYPDLETEDIRECLRFAASSVMERELPLPRSA
jgi:uncharacterized protein (DUF433 family)